MHIVIAGGSGFVGSVLQEQLLDAGYNVTVLTRTPEKIKLKEQLHAVQWLTADSVPEKV